MTEPTYALLRDGTVTDTIVAEPDFIAQLAELVADEDVDTPEALSGVTAVRIDQVDPRPGIGWTRAGAKWLPPRRALGLYSDAGNVPRDGSKPAVVELETDEPGPVTFTVNGLEVSRPVSKGIARLEVVSNTPGDRIAVKAGPYALELVVDE